MKKYFVTIFIFAIYLNLFAKISLTSQSNNSYIVDFEIGKYSVSNIDKFVQIRAENLFPSREKAGLPNLPFDLGKFIIPENGKISVSILSRKTKEIHIKNKIYPVPTIKEFINKDGNKSFSELPIISKEYNKHSSPIFKILPKDRFREFYFQSIEINPFNYKQKNSTVVINEKIRFLVTISGNVKQHRVINDNENFCSSLFLNWKSGKYWKSVKKNKNIKFFDFSKSDFWYKFEISTDGIYKITPQDLHNLPLNDIDPRTFRIFSTGGMSSTDSYNFTGNQMFEIPIEIDGEEDGSFDPNDKIVFYAQDRNGNIVNSHLPQSMYVNPYKSQTVYWLTFGGNFNSQPNRIKFGNNNLESEVSVSKIVKRKHYESENILEQSGRLKWFSDDLSGNSTSTYRYTINLEDFSDHQSYDPNLDNLANIDFIFRGLNGTYQVQINMNGNEGAVNYWSGSIDKNIIAHQNSSWHTGQNNLEIKVIRNSSSTLYLDYYDVYYFQDLVKKNQAFLLSVSDSIELSSCLQNKIVKYNFSGNSQGLRIFQIDNFHQITKLQLHNSDSNFYFIGQNKRETKYYVVSENDLKSIPQIANYIPTNITDTTEQYDAIIICPDIFKSQAQEMKDLHSSYENVKSKIVSQQSIFDVFNGGNTSPLAIRLYLKYVYNNFPSPKITHLILFGSGTHQWNHNNGINTEKNQIMTYIKGNIETDDGFAYLNSNSHPDLGVGRIPVKNESQANNYIEKLQNYLIHQQSEFWRNKVVFFADDNFHIDNLDFAHTIQMQEVSQVINPAVIQDKIFAIDYPFDPFRNKPEARDAMLASVNNGKLIWYYIGHGAYYGLGEEDYFIANTDMNFLHNKDKLTLFIAASCEVGEFDYLSFDSCADKLVNYTNGGSIVSIASTRKSYGSPNTNLIKQYLKQSLNNYYDTGISLILAKNIYPSTNSSKFVMFGDPTLQITPPVSNTSLHIVNDPDSLQARQLVKITGELSSPINGIGTTYVYDSSQPQSYVFAVTDTTNLILNITHPSKHLFKGKMTVKNGNIISNFIIPDDIKGGNLGKIVSFCHDENTNQNYTSYIYPLKINGHGLIVDNADAPKIELYLESYDFHDGDNVSSSPTLLANISDSNGINVLGSSGHKIFALIDNSNVVYNLSDYFVYDIDSYTSGKIEWVLPELTSGSHKLQLIAFDNFNKPSIQKINFKVNKNDAILITKMYPYPNPMKYRTTFTFTISSEANVTINIYTISGKKIRSLSKNNCKKGYNQIFWDGLDQDGNRIANNTYFYKLIARKLENNKKSYKLDRITVYH
jgi:hypothetical protein